MKIPFGMPDFPRIPDGISRSRLFLILLCYTALITYASLAPSGDINKWPFPEHTDKLVHFMMYAIQTYLLSWSIPKHTDVTSRNSLVFICACLAASYGLAMEFLQYAITSGDRLFALGDILANITGSLASACLISYLGKKGKRKKTKKNGPD